MMKLIETMIDRIRKIYIITLSMGLIIAALPIDQALAGMAAINAAPGTVSLSWKAPGDDSLSGQAERYSLRYSTALIDDSNFGQATEVTTSVPQVAGSVETASVESLSLGTTYYFAIKSVDEAGNWSSLSNITTIVTDSTNLQLANVEVNDISANSITVKWTSSLPGTAQIYYGPSSQLGWSTVMDSSLISNHVRRIDSIPAATSIYFRVASRDSLGREVLSSFYQITTDSASLPPVAILDLNASSGDENGEIDLEWTAPLDDSPDGKVSYYLLLCSEQPFGELDTAGILIYSNPPDPLMPSLAQSITMVGFEFGTMYYMAVRSVDAEGNLSLLSNLDSAVATYSIAADVEDEDDLLPTEYALAQNYPNPFNPTTTIEYSLPLAGPVRIDIYNIQGQLVKTLVDQTQTAGTHLVEWDGRNNQQAKIASGMYLYRLVTESFTESKKMVLLK